MTSALILEYYILTKLRKMETKAFEMRIRFFFVFVYFIISTRSGGTRNFQDHLRDWLKSKWKLITHLRLAHWWGIISFKVNYALFVMAESDLWMLRTRSSLFIALWSPVVDWCWRHTSTNTTCHITQTHPDCFSNNHELFIRICHTCWFCLFLSISISSSACIVSMCN